MEDMVTVVESLGRRGGYKEASMPQAMAGRKRRRREPLGEREEDDPFVTFLMS